MRRLTDWSGGGMLLAALLLAGCSRPTAPAVVRLIPPPPPREGPAPVPAETPAARAEKAPPPAEEKPAPAAPAPEEKKPAPEAAKPVMPPAEAAPAPAPAPPPPPEPRPARPQTELRGVMDRVVMSNTLQQIGYFYHIYRTEYGRPPARLDDFLEYIKTDGRMEYRALKEGSLVLELNADPDSNTVLAYEKDSAPDGRRLAVMGDASVQRLSAEEFRKALPMNVARGGQP